MDQITHTFSSDRTIDERRNILVGLLRQGVCKVTFIKVNGELRTMPCTLDPAIVPPMPSPKLLAEGEVPRVKKSNSDNMSVWCTDKNEWRSFKLVNVTEIASVNIQYENTMPGG
jgi:hypothetical protein